MPFVSNDQGPDEEKEDQPNSSQGAVAPVGGGSAVRLSPSGGVAPTGGGGASSGGGATGSPSTPGSTPTPASGGQFGTLNQYLTANQGQAAPLANKVTTGINNEYNNLNSQGTSTLSGINSQIAAGANPTDANANAIIAQESANPVSFTNNPGNVASFQSLLNASYGGPASAESTTGYQNQQNAVNSAISSGQNATSTEAGREGLLAQNEATPTTGVTALNSAILSQDPNALQSVENAYQPFSGLLTNLQQGAGTADQQIAQNQNTASQANQASNAAIDNQIGALNTGVTNELAAAQQNATAQNAQIKSDLAAGTPSASDLQALGMTPAQWSSLSSADKAAATSQVVSSNQNQFQANTGTATIDPTQFLTQQDPNAVYNAANTATPQDYANAQAYQTLLQGLNLSAPTTLINSSTAAQAGTAPTNLNSYNYQTALNTAQSTAAQEKAAAQAYVDAIQSGADEAHAQAQAQNATKNAGIIGGVTALTGPVGAVAAGMGNGANSAINAVKTDISNPSLKNTGNILSSTAKGVIGGATSAVNDAVSTVSNIFCFHPDTQVEMENGSTKAICKIKIGDETKGGKVLATTRGIGQGFYWYGGVLVTAKHAVKEDGIWVRVENSKNGRLFPYLTEVVCNLVTDKHRIWANGIEFSDEHENDNYENLNLQQSLDALNNNG